MKVKYSALFMMLCAASLIVFSADAAEASRAAVMRCINVIIPSLFAFMAVAEIICRCSIHRVLSKSFDKLAHLLFGMPKGMFPVFVLSNIAGYPVGLNMLAASVKNGYTDRRSAELMAVYCYAGGPSYAVAVVGEAVYGSKAIGLIIFFSSLLTNLVLATIINRVGRIRTEVTGGACPLSGEIFVGSVTSAGENLLKMCGIIVFFSGLTAALRVDKLIESIAERGFITHSTAVLLLSSLEISNITDLHPTAFGAVPFAAVVLGFGGLCVQLQLLTVLKGAFSLKFFYLTMPIRFLLNYGISWLLCRAFLPDVLPAYAADNKIIVEIDNFIPSICLIMMIFILVFKKRLAFFRIV